MQEQKKIIFLAGAQTEGWWFLPLLEQLAEHFAIKLVAFRHGEYWQRPSPVQVVLFEPIPDMSGYFRGLEDVLTDSDAIVSLDLASLASFQALRIARAKGIPFVALAAHTRPYLLQEFPNLLAVQMDIFQHASALVAMNYRAEACITRDGAPKEKIRVIEPFFKTSESSSGEEKRAKFRRQLTLSGKEQVMLYIAAHADEEEIGGLFRALRIAALAKPKEWENFRLLFVTPQPVKDQLKYLSVDLGIGRNLILIQQEYLPFWQDLVFAADSILIGKGAATYPEANKFPFMFIEAVERGLFPLLRTGTTADMALGLPPTFQIPEWSPHHIAEKIIAFLELTHDEKKSLAISLSAEVRRRFQNPASLAEWRTLLAEVEGARQSSQERRYHVEKTIRTWDMAEHTSSVITTLRPLIEEALSFEDLSPQLLADLWRVKGEMLLSTGDLDGATSAYQNVLQRNGKDHRALRGLGQVAWAAHSHEEALKFYKKALSLVPTDVPSVLGVGLVYRRLRMNEEAVQWLERAAHVEGTKGRSLGLLLQTLLELPHREYSLDRVMRIRENLGEVPAILRCQAQILLSLGRTEQGQALLMQASSIAGKGTP